MADSPNGLIPAPPPSTGNVRVHHGFGFFAQEAPRGSPTARFCLRMPDSIRDDNEVWINMGAGGIGDTLLGLCAVKGYKAAHPERTVVYRFHEENLRFVRMFDGYDGVATHQHDKTVNDFPPPDDNGNFCDARDLQLNAGYQLELTGKAQVSRLERYCRNVGWVTPVLPEVREPEKLLKHAKDYKDVVLLCPWASTADRTYPLQGWLSIEKGLRSEGYDTVVLGVKPDHGPIVIGSETQLTRGYNKGMFLYGTAERLEPRTDLFKSRVVTDPTPEELAGIILASRCVVGNDSGPAHIAGVMGKNVVVLCGWSVGDKIFGFYPGASSLQGVYDCNGCWTKAKEFDADRCNRECGNLASIDPQRVVREVMARVPAPLPET